MDDQGKMLFHGADPSVEGKVLVAEDEGGRDVTGSIIEEAETPSTSNPGIVEYCWDDPDVRWMTKYAIRMEIPLRERPLATLGKKATL